MFVWSKTRFVILFIITAILGCAGIGMIIEGRQGGWPTILFATAGALVFIAMLSPIQPRTELLRTQITQYPKPITLTGRRGRRLLVALASTMFALVFFLGLLSSPALLGSVVFHSVLLVVFGAFGVILIAGTIKPSRLTLDTEGLTLKTVFRTRRWKWRDIRDFRAISVVTYGKRIIKAKHIIGFDDRNATQTARVNRHKKRVGASTSFPNQFGPSDDELASALNAWRQLAISDSDR